MIDTLRRDVAHALRSLRRRPLLAAAAVLSLALGIGVNTAIFSLFHRLVLERLAVDEPDRIVLLASPGRKPGGTSSGDSGGTEQVFSYPLFRDLERLSYRGVSQIAAHRDFDANVASRGRPDRAHGLLVSGRYFESLHLAPSAGRLLSASDDQSGGANPVAVLSYSYWTAHFGGDPTVVGQRLTVNGEALTVVGVGPAGFVGTTTMDATDVFVPLSMTERVRAWPVSRRDHWLYVFARLAPDADRGVAEAAMNGPFRALLRDVEFPAIGDGLTTDEVPEFLARRIVLVDGSRGRQQAREQVRLLVSLLFTVSGLVLLIACANIANLLMARAADRAAEISVRISLGASAAGLMRLLLIESTMFGVLGAVAGLGVARATVIGLTGLMPRADVGPLHFTVNGPIVTFTILLGVGSGLIFGLVPAFHAVRGRMLNLAVAERTSPSRNAARFRTSLATLQVALATALLATASLLTSSLAGLTHADTGMKTAGVLTFNLAPYLNGYTQLQSRDLYEHIAADLRALPGVTAVTMTSIPILADSGWNQRVAIRRADRGSDQIAVVSTMRIGSDYFRTLGIPLRAGREFGSIDVDDSPLVAIVNRTFLTTFGLDLSAVGSPLALGVGARQLAGIEIVGIVDDAKYSNMHDPPPAQLYLPYRQSPVGPLTFYVRAASNPAPLLAMIPAAVARLDPALPVEDLRTVDDQIWENVTRDRVLAMLSSAFATLAVVLAATGLYAILAFTVAQRRREFGIRMAVGASPGDVRSLIARYVGRMTVVGTTAGLVVAIGLGRMGEAFFYGVHGREPLLIGGAAMAMAVIAMLAAVVPTHRATHVDPALALRAE